MQPNFHSSLSLSLANPKLERERERERERLGLHIYSLTSKCPDSSEKVVFCLGVDGFFSPFGAQFV